MGYLKDGKVWEYIKRADRKTLFKMRFFYFIGKLVRSKKLRKKIANYLDDLVQ